MGPCFRRDDERGFVKRPNRHCERSEAIHLAALRANGSRECVCVTRRSSLRKQGPIRRALSFWSQWPQPSFSLNAGGYGPCFRRDDERGFVKRPNRHCERSEAIHLAAKKVWIASSLPPSLVELRRTSRSSQ